MLPVQEAKKIEPELRNNNEFKVLYSPNVWITNPKNYILEL